MTKTIQELLRDAQRKLVDTGTRNRLIHVNRESRRGNDIKVINERTKDIFEILRINGRSMKFLGTAQDDNQIDDDMHISPDNEVDVSRYRDNVLETPLGPEVLYRKLLKLYRDARTAEEEQGVNILYLAMGFLEWYEDKSSQIPRTAPLILLPVKLVRNDGDGSFRLSSLDDDISTNLPLQERLKKDFGVRFPDIDDSADWFPEEYFAAVKAAIATQQRWKIESDGMQLGFFSFAKFAKFLMLHDLDPENWEESNLQENKLLQRLLRDGFPHQPSLLQDGERLDSKFKPTDLIQVVDADASQTEVIEEVRAGMSLVVQGPPGTGKSQTIANMIAAAVHDGKSVLFIAEKMTALQVVHRRLHKVGLADICLELHSRKANKKAVLEELKRTLDAGYVKTAASDEPDKLHAARQRLNEIADTIHELLPERDYSPFSVMNDISGFISRDVSAPDFKNSSLADLCNSQRDEIVNVIESFLSKRRKAGAVNKHPFFGVGELALQPTELQRLEKELTDVIQTVRSLVDTAAEAAQRLVCPHPENISEAKRLHILLGMAISAPDIPATLVEAFLARRDEPRLPQALEIGQQWRQEHSKVQNTFQEAAWSAPIDDIRSNIAQGAGSFWSRLFGRYRSASNELATLLRIALPKQPSERLALVDQLQSVRRLRAELAREEEYLRTVLGTEWRGESTAFNNLIAAHKWVGGALAAAPEVSHETISILCSIKRQAGDIHQKLESVLAKTEDVLQSIFNRLDLDARQSEDRSQHSLVPLQKRFEDMHSSMERYSEWVDLMNSVKALDKADLMPLITALQEGRLAESAMVDEFRYAVAEARWEYARTVKPELNDLAKLNRHDLVTAFRELDHTRFEEVRALIHAQHQGQLPKGADGEMGFLRGEMAKKRKHRPIRKIIEAAPTMMRRIACSAHEPYFCGSVPPARHIVF